MREILRKLEIAAGVALVSCATVLAASLQSHPNKYPPTNRIRSHQAVTRPRLINRFAQNAVPLLSNGSVTLYGDVVYSDNWEESMEYGVRQFSTQSSTLTAVSPTDDSNFRATGGAVYKDGHYYMIKGDEYSCTFYDYSTDDWSEQNEDEVSTKWLATDLTVNPSDNKIYAVMSDGKGGQELTTVSFDDETRTAIGSLKTMLATLSSDSYGTLYGIGTDGALYKVDATNATETYIGNTGVEPVSMQSATFDFATNTLYWAATTSDNVGALYSVDVTTGKASLVYNFPGNEEIVGLYSLSEAKPWEGPDAPAAPTHVKATYADGTATLSWTAPTTGLHKGSLDENGISYTVVRMPDNDTIADNYTNTTLTDKIASTELAAYYYVVTAKNSVGEGGSAQSNTFVAGTAVTPPYVQNFSDATSFALLTLVDADGDGSTWSPSVTAGCATSAGAPFDNTDDWLFTPAISLKSDRLYRLHFATTCELAANYPYTMRAVYTDTPTADAVATVIQADTTINVPETQQLGGYFSVKADGNYNVGIEVHGYDIQNIHLNNIRVEAGPKYSAPDSVRDLTVTADADGAAKATLSFMTPTTTVKGDALTSLQYLVIKRDGAPIDTLRNVSPGEKISYTDDQAVKNKVNTYEVVACNEEGEGMPVSQSTYVGIDVPLPPTLLVASYGDNGKINLSWKAPATGVTGGYIDPDNLYYGIQRSVGGKAVVLTNNQKQTTYTDQIDDSGEQAYLLYGVSAANRSGYSDLATSNALIKGTPYTLPFMETLKDGSTDHFWGMQSSVTDSHAAWGAQDGAFMFSSSYQPGDDALLYSGKISLANAKNPILEYDYWYRAEEGDDSLLVYVIKNGHDTTLVSRQNYVRYMYAKDYEKITVPLKQFATADTKFIQVAFYLKTYSSDATQMASVRNVTVRDQHDHDLMASSISAPAQVQVGDTVHVVARVKNYGSQTSGKYSVKLYDHDKVVGTSEADALPSDSVAQFIFKIPVTTLQDSLYFHFTVDDAADEVAANNTSSDAGVAVTLPVYPKPEKLTASQESAGKVTLSWTAPAYEDFVIPTTDGAEAYDAFAIDNIGEWTVVDRDHKATRSDITVDSYDVNFTHKGDAMAWIVMNPSKAGASFTNWMGDPTGWQPVSGDQYFASFSAADSTNDDWLISPELPGDAQTISFSEHGYYGMEHYEVLYSTTDTNPSSFVSLGEKTSDASWTQVSFDLPAGAKYFAIRNLGAEYSQYLFVDDINFKPLSGKGVLQLCGYRIYADGELVDSVAANVLQYVVADAATLYQVTAVYNRGESAAASCQGVSTGINRVEIPGGIHLCGSVLSSNDPVRVFTASGTLVFEGIANHIRLTHGFYIIQVGNKSYKVTVR